jgi:hypothetical protein
MSTTINTSVLEAGLDLPVLPGPPAVRAVLKETDLLEAALQSHRGSAVDRIFKRGQILGQRTLSPSSVACHHLPDLI